MEIAVVLHNIRSCLNVGAILRTAEGFGVERAILSGYTPRYEDMRELPHLREKLNKQIEKTALGAEKYVPMEIFEDVTEGLRRLKNEGYVIVGLENNLEDERKIKATRGNFSEVLTALKKRGEQGKVALLLGEEVKGISKDLYDLIDVFLEIPMRGRKESFNVSVAAGVGLFYLREVEETGK